MAYKSALAEFKSKYVIGDGKLLCGHLGMGKSNAWYGCPDGRF